MDTESSSAVSGHFASKGEKEVLNSSASVESVGCGALFVVVIGNAM